MKEASKQNFETILGLGNCLNFQNNPTFIDLSLLLFEIYAPKVVAISEIHIFPILKVSKTGGSVPEPLEHLWTCGASI